MHEPTSDLYGSSSELVDLSRLCVLVHTVIVWSSSKLAEVVHTRRVHLASVYLNGR